MISFIETVLLAVVFAAVPFATSGADVQTNQANQSSQAEKPKNAPTKTTPQDTGTPGGSAALPPSGPEVPHKTRTTDPRSWLLNVHYSFLDMLIPGKIGGAVLYRPGPGAGWELEYSRGSLAIPFLVEDLGKMNETRISLLRRYGRDGVGFQFFYGLFYQSFTVTLGNEILSRLSGGAVPAVDLIEISSVGAAIGAGYRWRFGDRWVFGLDGLAWSQPIVNAKRSAPFLDVATNQTDRDHVESAIKLIQYMPRFSVAKVSIGAEF